MTLILRYGPISLALAIVGLMWLEGSRRPTASDAEPFHAAAAKVVGEIPLKFGSWEGTEIPVPPAAQTLLKPNAMMSRSYVDRETREQVGVMLVQCRDPRDMAGHYPPVCYPGHGWTAIGSPSIVELRVGSTSLRAARYEFERQTFDQARLLIIYNFFALPGKGLLTEMSDIRNAAADYASRPFGAAQIQVALNRRRPPDEESALVGQLLAPVEPAIGVLSDGKWTRQ